MFSVTVVDRRDYCWQWRGRTRVAVQRIYTVSLHAQASAQ